jgi:hypothetical protein
MSHFASKLGHDLNSFGRKLGHAVKSFGNKNHIHNLAHAVDKVAEYAIPAMGIATLADPALLPITGTIGTAIKVAQGATHLGAKFVDDVGGYNKPRNPQLQR